jgi:preprotein translocase subunit SecF
MEHLAGKRHLWFAISGALLIPGIMSLILFGLQFGVDFSGGTLWQVQFEEQVGTEPIVQALSDHGRSEATVQRIGAEDEHRYQIRMKELRAGSAEKDELTEALNAIAPLNPGGERLDTVGGIVASSLRSRSLLAVGAAAIGILLYIAYAFRNTQRPMLYGIAAIVAMIHDTLFVLGIFSILGRLAGVEIDALFITAVLTVIGFSVHDTIVVFDRIRENLHGEVADTFEEVVNYSIAQTIVRSLNTSITVVLTLAALFLFGGSTTREFVLALLIGVIIGTYSSIFNASQILVAWENGEIQRFFRRIFRRQPTPTAETA